MPQKKAKSEKKDKRYRAKVTIGHDESGRAIVKYASGRTRKELAENKAELVRRFIGGAEVRRDVLSYARAGGGLSGLESKAVRISFPHLR